MVVSMTSLATPWANYKNLKGQFNRAIWGGEVISVSRLKFIVETIKNYEKQYGWGQ